MTSSRKQGSSHLQEGALITPEIEKDVAMCVAGAMG
jgi:hypothetical protein